MDSIALAVFIFTGMVHGLALIFKWKKIRIVSKVCLLPPLIVFYILRADRFLPAVVAAGCFGWLGDIFLLKIEKSRYFTLGLAGFLLGHLCYILAILSVVGNFHLPLLGISTAAAVPLGILVLRAIKPEGAMRIPTIIYGIVILIMSLCAFQLMLFRRDAAGIAVFTGSLFFLYSDSVLAYFTFRTTPEYGHLLVMLTYSIAQGCLVAGLAGC